MLANIVVGPVSLIHVISLKARVRHILLVDAPAHLSGLEEIDDGLRAGVDPLEAVVDDAVRVCAAGRDIVGLRRVGDGVVVVEKDALLREVRQVSC